MYLDPTITYIDIERIIFSRQRCCNKLAWTMRQVMRAVFWGWRWT